MKHVIILLFLLASVVDRGMAQEIIWQNTIGGDEVDELESVVQTADGGFILGGSSGSNISGDKTENRVGLMDYWIVKTDTSGSIQWQKTIGGIDQDYLISIAQTADNGYILGGYSLSGISGNKTEVSYGDYDYWVVKLDSAGIIQWQKTIGGSAAELLQSVQQTPDGGYIIAGSSESGISGNKTEDSNGQWDYWIIKLSVNGTIQWQNTIGGNSTDYLFSVTQTVDGGYLLGGRSESNISGDKTANNKGGSDYWMVKVSSTGSIEWDKTIGGNGYDVLAKVLTMPDHGFLLCGSSFSNISGDKTEDGKGGNDYWIVKTDSSGSILWQKTIGGNLADFLYDACLTNDGGFIAGGLTNSGLSGNKTEVLTGANVWYDFWIVKVDSSGNIQWQNTIGGYRDDQFRSIIETNSGDYLIGGYSKSDISGDKSENTIGPTLGQADYWLMKVNGQMNQISGKAFIDINSDGFQDLSEPAAPHLKIIEFVAPRLGFTDSDGNYVISVRDQGNYEISAENLNYYNSIPLLHAVSFSGSNQTDSLNDFSLQASSAFNDLCLSVTPSTPFRPGFNASYVISYENVGTTVINNASVVFYPDNNISFVSSSVTPSNIFPDSIIWNIGALTPFQSGNIVVTVSVNVGVAIGTVINSGAVIYPVAGDANPNCNTHYWEVFVTGSFDPNDILVDRDTLYNYEISNPPYLEYIIRFQNTGNDTAFTVKILNPLDTTKLQLNTLEFVASSHPVDMRFVYHESNMEFLFSNILLPDSNVNEPMSHGFVRYRIKPKTTLAVGDIIGNNAYIYFDFNDPIATNTAITKVVLPTGVATAVAVVEWNVYPNPASGDVKVSFTLKQDAVVKSELFNTTGQLVFSEQSNYAYGSHEMRLPVADLPKGVYYIRLSVNGNVMVKKVVRI